MRGILQKIRSSTLPTTLDFCVRWAVFLLVVYWGVFALLAPITVWDSHVYNLGRLAVAERGGLFGNTLWTSERQVMFPWSFDAIHLPFLHIGWGYALPSFACLLGTAWILFQIIRRVSGSRTARLAVLALFAMPTVIYQATSTKNDMGLVFVAACAAYGLFRFREQMNPRWLVLSAVAVGFLPGIKTSGLPLAIFLAGATFWLLRGRYRLLAGWVIVATASFCLLGSLEIYINNVRLYSHSLGPPLFVHPHANNDGLAGIVANTIRYVFGLINLGWPPYSHEPIWQLSLETMCRDLLQTLHLTDKGCRPEFPDRMMRFLKTGWEAASDFGPLGTAAMVASTMSVLTFRKNKPACWTALAGWALLAVTAATTAWMPWNMRFIMLPLILFVAASLLTLTRPIAQMSWVYAGIVVFILYGATVYPLCSFNKRPVDMVNAVRNREAVTLKERASMQEVFDAVRRSHADSPATPWLLHAGSDSWVFGLLTMTNPKFDVVQQIEANTLNAAAASPSGEVLILVLNRTWSHPATTEQMRQLIRFKWEKDSGIYAWRTPTKVQSHTNTPRNTAMNIRTDDSM